MDIDGNRRTYPSSYLFTKQESRTIEKAFLVCAPLWVDVITCDPAKIVFESQDFKPDPQILDEMQHKAILEMRSKRIYKKDLISIFEKLERPHFTIEIRQISADDGKPCIYQAVTSEDESIEFTTDPAFTNPIRRKYLPTIPMYSDPAEWAKIIEVPAGFLYLTETERRELLIISRLFPDIVKSAEGSYPISNTNIAMALVGISGRSIFEKYPEQKRTSDGDEETYISYVAYPDSKNKDRQIIVSVLEKLDSMGSFREVGLKKLYEIVVSESLRHDSDIIYIPLDRYMDLTGLTSKDKARAKISEQLSLLQEGARITVKNGRNNYLRLDILQTQGIINGVIRARLNTDFFNELKRESERSGYIRYPKAVLRIPNQKVNEFNLATAFLRRERNNVSKTDRKALNNRLSVNKLIENYLTIPSRSVLRIENDERHAKKRIIDPLYKVLEYLEENEILAVTFIDPETKKPITQEQFDSIFIERGGDIELLSRLTVECEWLCQREDLAVIRDNAKKHQRRKGAKK